MRHTRFIKRAAGILASAALGTAPAAAAASVSTGHSSWDWGFPTPQGQDLNAVAFSGSTGYAVGAFGTVLRSDDSGATWKGLPSGVTSPLRLLQEVNASTVVVAGGCDVSESSDGGASFTALPLNLGGGSCFNSVAGISFSDPKHGYVALSDGSLYYTDDGGTTLQAKTSVPTDGDAVATGLTFTSPTTGFAITSDGAIERTTDGGNSWTLVNKSGASLSAITFAGSDTAYVVGAGGLLLVSTDGGQTWTAPTLKIGSGGVAGTLTGIACSSTTECLITTGRGALIRTTDGGQTGTIVSPSNEDLLGVAFATGSTAVAVGTEGATVVSTDGGATFPAEPSGNLRQFAITPDPLSRAASAGGAAGSAYVGGENGEIAATTDAGSSWSELRVPTGQEIRGVQFPTTQTGYAFDQDGALHRTTNGGVSWSSFPTRYDSASVLAAPAADTVLLVGPKGVRRSTNGGSSFAPVAALSSLRLWHAITRGRKVLAWGPSGIVVSTDGGRRWRQVHTPVHGGQISSVSFIGPKLVWMISGAGRLLATTNGGRTWTASASVGAIGELDTVSFANPRDGMISLVENYRLDGTSFGQVSLLSTTDGGTTWQPEIVNGGHWATVIDTNSGAYLADTTQSSSVPADEGSPAGFFSTPDQGRIGSPSSLTLALPRRHTTAAALAKAGHRVVLHGRLSPVTVTGQTVAISYGGPAGGWRLARTRVATDGSFSVTIPGIRGTTDFVAQSLGNGAVDAGATKPVQLVVKH